MNTETVTAQKPQINVAAALIWNDSRLLIAQRELLDTCGGLWEFPGGKQEVGETLQNCLRREIREELDVGISVGKLFTRVIGHFEKATVVVHVFHCQYETGEPKTLECADWRWVTLPELAQFEFTSLDQDVIQLLLKENK